MKRRLFFTLTLGAFAATAAAGVGDPQVKTDHPWYPGELSCSTFERLFNTQAELYQRVTGRKVQTQQDKALASWYWRNLNYFHCTAGPVDAFDKGIQPGGQGEFVRDYWTGLFANGFGLCYATHAQWCGEMEQLLGTGRFRGAGVDGHSSFEVYLTGGPYGEGRWAALDHDVSTVIFTPDGKRLMSMTELSKDAASRNPRNLSSQRQHGWLAGGLHPDDPGTYARFGVAYYAHGYAGPPPMVHLRAGESVRRDLKPGLEDGKTFVYWGINYMEGGIPGPTRHRTWVNQPEKMYLATSDAGYHPGQARFANAVYTYRPDFTSAKYKEGVIDESDGRVTFEFYTPYVIAAAPPERAAREKWGVCEPGCTAGLVLHGKMKCPVEISTDQGRTWQKAGAAQDGMDLTDLVKGHQQYWIRFGAGARTLRGTGLTIRTACQTSSSMIPRLVPGMNRITFASSGRAVTSAGPNRDQAAAHLIDGAMDSPAVTLELGTPRGEKAVRLYVASHNSSGCPPKDARYNVEYSPDGGKTYRPVLKDWEIIRHLPEPGDWWSQSFCHADAALPNVAGPIRVRFSNTGGRNFQRVEAHLVYEVPKEDTSPVRVTFAYRDGGQLKTADHTYEPHPDQPDSTWSIDAGERPETIWVEYATE